METIKKQKYDEDIFMRFESIYSLLMMLQIASKHPDAEGAPMELAIEGIKYQLDDLKNYVLGDKFALLS